MPAEETESGEDKTSSSRYTEEENTTTDNTSTSRYTEEKNATADNTWSCRHLEENNKAKESTSPTERTECYHSNCSDNGVSSNIPIDRGWAWVVCAGCFFITFVMSLYDQVLAVMLVDVVDKFKVEVTTVVVVFTIFSFTFAAGSVISTNVLVPRFGVRVVIVTAAIINSTSTLIIAVSTNIAFYLTIHLFKGLAIGSMWIPAIGLLGHYFKRRRSLASSFTNIGISVALLAVPPLVRLLLNNYRFLGSLLIISGIEMQAVAVAMLLRPPSQYARRENKVLSNSKSYKNEKERSLLDKIGLECHQSIPTQHNGHADDEKSTCNFTASSGTAQFDKEYKKQKHTKHNNDEEVNRNFSTQLNDFQNNVANYKRIHIGSGIDEENALLDPTSQGKDENHAVFDQINVDNKQSPLQAYRVSVPQKDVPGGNTIPNGINMGIILASSDLEIKGEHKYEKDETLSKRSTSSRFLRCSLLRKFFDVDLLSDWLMRLMMASTVFGALLLYIPSYIPTLAIDRGVDKLPAAMLLTVCGGVSLLCTMLQGLVVDCKFITAARFMVIAQVAVGSMCHLVRFFNSFPTLLLLSISQGMFGGARMSLMPILAMDFVGVKNLSKALGFNAMVATLSLSIHHPFLGFLQAKYGFDATFHYVGFALYVSSALLLLENTGRKLNSRRHVVRISN